MHPWFRITSYNVCYTKLLRKIDWKDYPYDAVLNKLMTNIAGGDAPDVVNLNTELANQMGTKDALVDFNQELTADSYNFV